MKEPRILRVVKVDGQPRLGIDHTFIYIYTEDDVTGNDRYIYLGHKDNALYIEDMEAYIDIKRKLGDRVKQYVKLICVMFTDNPNTYIQPCLLKDGSMIIISE